MLRCYYRLLKTTFSVHIFQLMWVSLSLVCFRTCLPLLVNPGFIRFPHFLQIIGYRALSMVSPAPASNNCAAVHRPLLSALPLGVSPSLYLVRPAFFPRCLLPDALVMVFPPQPTVYTVLCSAASPQHATPSPWLPMSRSRRRATFSNAVAHCRRLQFPDPTFLFPCSRPVPYVLSIWKSAAYRPLTSPLHCAHSLGQSLLMLLAPVCLI